MLLYNVIKYDVIKYHAVHVQNWGKKHFFSERIVKFSFFSWYCPFILLLIFFIKRKAEKKEKTKKEKNKKKKKKKEKKHELSHMQHELSHMQQMVLLTNKNANTNHKMVILLTKLCYLFI